MHGIVHFLFYTTQRYGNNGQSISCSCFVNGQQIDLVFEYRSIVFSKFNYRQYENG